MKYIEYMKEYIEQMNNKKALLLSNCIYDAIQLQNSSFFLEEGIEKIKTLLDLEKYRSMSKIMLFLAFISCSS